MSDIVKHWTAEMGRGLFLDGVEFPWPVAMDPMFRIEPMSDYHHILWLPVIVDGPAPEYGRPDGEVPVLVDQPSDGGDS